MRKIVLLFLVSTILYLPIMPISAAESEKADFTFLKSIGILDDAFRTETAYVSRAEAAMLLVRASGADEVTDARIFSDVEAGDPYAAEIATAQKLGIICGFEDGTFHPRQSVTVNQMLKMILSLIGFGQNAEAQGGYPAGYQIVANQKDILTSLNAYGESPLDYDNMTKLMRAALNTTIAEGIAFNEDYIEYKETDESVLSAWHGIDKVTGMVSADYFVILSAERAVQRDEIAIDGNVYSVGKTNAQSLLCQQVEAYVERETNTILYIEPRASSRVITIPAEKVTKVDTSFLTYETENGKEGKVSISDVKLIKNGTLLERWTADDLRFTNGRFQFVESNGGNLVYIIAEQYTNRIVDYVSDEGNMVHFKDGGSLEVNMETGNKRTRFTETNGYPAELTYCYPWDVFSVMEGKNVLKIVRSEKFIMGKVEEISSESITIDGIEYDFAPGFWENKTLTKPTLGMEADFYFDYTNKLAAIDTSHSKNGSYGILVGISSKNGLNPQIQVKIYTEEAQMRGFEVADKVTVNGGTPLEEAALLENESLVSSDTDVIRQLIVYKVNGKGEITRIDTATDYTSDPDNEARLSCFSRDMYIDASGYSIQQPYTELTYNFDNEGEDSAQFGRKYLARSQTKIFQLPPEGAEDTAYKMVSFSDLGYAEKTMRKRIALYDVDANYHIAAMVWEKTNTETLPTHANERLFVTKTYVGLDADGMTTYFIEGYNDTGKQVALTVEDDMIAYFAKALTDPAYDKAEYFEDIKNPVTWPQDHSDVKYYANGKNKHYIRATEIIPGDLLNYVAMANGKATLLNVVARANTAPEYEINYDNYWHDLSINYNGDYIAGSGHCYTIAFGTVKSRTADSIVTETYGRVNGKKLVRSYLNKGINLLYDKKTGTTREIKFSEIHVGDKVLTWNRVSDFVFTIVIR